MDFLQRCHCSSSHDYKALCCALQTTEPALSSAQTSGLMWTSRSSNLRFPSHCHIVTHTGRFALLTTRKQMAAFGWSGWIRVPQLPWGPRGIRTSHSCTRASQLENCDLIQPSYFTPETHLCLPLRPRQVKELFKVTQWTWCYSRQNSSWNFRYWNLIWLLFHRECLIIVFLRTLRTMKTFYRACFLKRSISLPYFLWKSLWLRVVNYRYISLG